MENSNWTDLTYEILITILMTLNVADIAAASMVCKSWNKACHDPSLWHTLDLSKLSSYCFNIPNNELGAYRHPIHSRRKMTQFLNYVLSLSNGNTTCLIFNYYVYLTDNQFITAAERTPNLKRLVLPKTGDFTRVGVDMAMKLWGGLESITLTSAVSSHDIFPAIREYCKNITEMKFTSNCPLEVRHAAALVQYTPNLKVLSIRSVAVNIKALCILFTYLEHLEVVNICHSFLLNMSDHAIIFLDIRDLPNHLPPSSLGKLMYCEDGWCLRCKNGRDTTPSRQPHGPLEDIWREDEIKSLAH